MDKFVTITKPAALASSGNGNTTRRQFKYNPYPIPKAKERQVEAWRDKKRTEKIIAPLREEKKIPSGSKALTKHLLNTLKEETNPVTHSIKGRCSEHVDSCATGHQRSDSRRPSAYSKSRSKKLEDQRQEMAQGSEVNGVLEGIKIYVGGYIAGTTDIEMKRIVTMAGGKIMHTAAGATHILTSQGLSGSKTHKYLRTGNKTHVVTPEWVFDSIAAGKRKKEWDYTVIKDSTTYGLEELGVKFSHSC